MNIKSKSETTEELKINEAHESIYRLKFGFWFKVVIICSFTFVLAIVINFPLKSLLLSQSEKLVRSQTVCPINFDELEFSWFMPKLKFIKPEIQGSCFGPGREDLPLTKFNLALNRPTFFPPGLQFQAEIEAQASKLDVIYVLSPSGQYIAAQKGIIQGELISKITGMDIVQGDISLELRADMGSKTLKELALHIKSTNLYILGQNTPLFKTPALDLGNLSLKGKLEDGRDFIVDELIVGKADSPIKTDFKGSIQLNTYNMMFSTYNLRGEMRIENELLDREELALLKMLLSGRAHPDGSYRLEVKGPLNGMPQANFL